MQLEPIVSFAILLAVILIVPLCFERLKLPGLLGLLLAGVALGQNGLNLLNHESETMKLLSGIGLVYLLFVAGLEIDLKQFKATKYRSAGFGFFTFAIPLVFGTIVGRIFGFDWNASVLIGSLFASHTLLAYPIVSRLGLVTNESIVVTIGATIFTDIGSLLVLAICVGINKGNFSLFTLTSLLLSLLIYSAIVLFGFNWLGKAFFRRSGDEEGNQFLFILLVVFLAALGAELIGVEKIIGAFLAGLAVNSIVGEGPVKEKILFVGNVLFIPIFFVDIGLLVDLPAFIRSLSAIWLMLAIVTGLIFSKFLAAMLAKFAYRYSWREGITMWSLSMPQVAATLAATFVGYREGMLTEDVLNSVIVLMLVTATLGPIITARAAAGLTPTTVRSAGSVDLAMEEPLDPPGSAIVVPLYNPTTQRNLLEMASLLARHGVGRIVPITVTLAHVHMDAPELEAALQRNQDLLTQATELSKEFGATIEPVLRIDDDIAQGISRASREQDASLIVMGLGQTSGLRARLFGNLIDRVLWSSHCPVAVTRLLRPPAEIHRILVPIEPSTHKALKAVQFAAILAEANQAELMLLHVADPYSSPERMAWLKTELDSISMQVGATLNPQIQIISAEDVVGTIVEQSRAFDLVVLRTHHRRSNTIGDVNLSDITTSVVKQLRCSIVLLGEPQHRATSTPAYRSRANSVSDSAKNSTA